MHIVHMVQFALRKRQASLHQKYSLIAGDYLNLQILSPPDQLYALVIHFPHLLFPDLRAIRLFAFCIASSSRSDKRATPPSRVL